MESKKYDCSNFELFARNIRRLRRLYYLSSLRFTRSNELNSDNILSIDST